MSDIERCVEDVCGGEVIRWHRCQDHYQQLVDAEELVASLKREENFWVRVNKEGEPSEFRPELGPCWWWIGAPDTNGYGRLSNRATVASPAHRYSYELLVGPIPEGLELDHLCRVRRCVRPSHLEPVTHAENMHRSWEVRPLKTHCKYGHSFEDEANFYRSGRTRVCRKCAVRRKEKWLAKKLRELETAA